MLDRSVISSVPLRGATDDDVVTWSLRGDGSSCVQAAYHWNDTSLLAATTHNTLRYTVLLHVQAGRSTFCKGEESKQLLSQQGIFTSLSLCLTA